MSFSFISKISLYLSFVFIISCQDTILSFKNNNDNNLNTFSYNYQLETEDFLDISFFEEYKENFIDNYTYKASDYNFLDKELNKLKINNYESKYNNNNPINVIYLEQNIYSINKDGELLKFDLNTGKLIEKINIELDQIIKVPISISLFKKDFIIAFISGEVVRVNKLGQVIWIFKNQDFLNTPIKIYDDYLIILYPEKIIFLSNLNGTVIYEKTFESSNIIQSSGGKIKNYYNIIFFILPNSKFVSLDTYLFDEHSINFENIELNTSLNNLNDQIHVYKNFLVYFDNGNILHTYDINKKKFVLVDFLINNSSSSILFNNSLISKNENFVELYNIKNGKLFSRIDINETLNKESKIIKVLIFNKNLHIFTDEGEILILDQNFEILETVNLKIKNINKVYNYQNKIFISTKKGITYIY